MPKYGQIWKNKYRKCINVIAACLTNHVKNGIALPRISLKSTCGPLSWVAILYQWLTLYAGINAFHLCILFDSEIFLQQLSDHYKGSCHCSGCKNIIEFVVVRKKLAHKGVALLVWYVVGMLFFEEVCHCGGGF